MAGRCWQRRRHSIALRPAPLLHTPDLVARRARFTTERWCSDFQCLSEGGTERLERGEQGRGGRHRAATPAAFKRQRREEGSGAAGQRERRGVEQRERVRQPTFNWVLAYGVPSLARTGAR